MHGVLKNRDRSRTRVTTMMIKFQESVPFSYTCRNFDEHNEFEYIVAYMQSAGRIYVSSSTYSEIASVLVHVSKV